MGILPTDTYPALVCDLEAKAAVQKIYDIKQMSPSKQLSILCRSLTDIGTYTLGFPVSQIGRTATFKLARQVLPGPVSPPASSFHCAQPPSGASHQHSHLLHARWLPGRGRHCIHWQLAVQEGSPSGHAAIRWQPGCCSVRGSPCDMNNSRDAANDALQGPAAPLSGFTPSKSVSYRALLLYGPWLYCARACGDGRLSSPSAEQPSHEWQQLLSPMTSTLVRWPSSCTGVPQQDPVSSPPALLLQFALILHARAPASLTSKAPTALLLLQYTFILHASKALPKQVTDWEAGKSRQRKSVGVRMPDDVICQVTPCWWPFASASMVAL